MIREQFGFKNEKRPEKQTYKSDSGEVEVTFETRTNKV